MKAFRLEFRGQTQAAVVAQEIETPRPGPGQVLVRIHARSLNYRDVLILEGRYPVPARDGVVPVSDGAGVVAAVGPGVEGLKAGDRVTTVYFPRWASGAFVRPFAMEQFGCTRDGVLTEFVLAEADGVMPFPDHLSFEEAATLPCAGVTAWAALHGPRPVLPGETVMTQGGGGVSLFALRFARMSGARTIVVTASMERAAQFAEAGADEVVGRDDDGRWVQTVRQLTGGRGVDHIVETGSLQTIAASIACGHESAVATVVAAVGPGTISTSVLNQPMLMRRTYVGSRAHFAEMNRAIAAQGMRPVIGARHDFADAAGALRQFADRQHFGKVVIA